MLFVGPQMDDKTNLGTKHAIAMWTGQYLFLIRWGAIVSYYETNS